MSKRATRRRQPRLGPSTGMRPRVPSSNLSTGEACRWVRDAAVVTWSATEYAGKAGVEGLEGEPMQEVILTGKETKQSGDDGLKPPLGPSFHEFAIGL